MNFEDPNEGDDRIDFCDFINPNPRAMEEDGRQSDQINRSNQINQINQINQYNQYNQYNQINQINQFDRSQIDQTPSNETNDEYNGSPQSLIDDYNLRLNIGIDGKTEIDVNTGIDKNMTLNNGASGSKDPNVAQLNSLIEAVSDYGKKNQDDEVEKDLIRRFGVLLKNMTVYRRSNYTATTGKIDLLASFTPQTILPENPKPLHVILNSAGYSCPDVFQIDFNAFDPAYPLKYFKHSIVFPENNIQSDKFSKKCLFLVFSCDRYTMVLQNKAELTRSYSKGIKTGKLTKSGEDFCGISDKTKVALKDIVENELLPIDHSSEVTLNRLKELKRSEEDRKKYVTEEVESNKKAKRVQAGLVKLDFFFKTTKKGKENKVNNGKNEKNKKKSMEIIKESNQSMNVSSRNDHIVKDSGKSKVEESKDIIGGLPQKYSPDDFVSGKYNIMCESELIIYDNTTKNVFKRKCYIKYTQDGFDVYLFYSNRGNEFFFKLDLTSIHFDLFGTPN